MLNRKLNNLIVVEFFCVIFVLAIALTFNTTTTEITANNPLNNDKNIEEENTGNLDTDKNTIENIVPTTSMTEEKKPEPTTEETIIAEGTSEATTVPTTTARKDELENEEDKAEMCFEISDIKYETSLTNHDDIELFIEENFQESILGKAKFSEESNIWSIMLTDQEENEIMVYLDTDGNEYKLTECETKPTSTPLD